MNQAEKYEMVEMTSKNDRWVATIPATYTQSPFPLQYYFEVRMSAGDAAVNKRTTLYPGLGGNFCNQPYYVIRQS